MTQNLIQNPHLEGYSFFWEAGPIGVLLIHGFTATTAEVRPLARVLRGHGYSVAGPLLPGHNTTPEDCNRVRWQDWAETAEEMYQRLAARFTRVVVGGESTGALLALDLAFRHPEIAGLLLYAPALRLSLSWFDLLRLHVAARFIPYIPKKSTSRGNVDLQWQGYPVHPLKGTLQLLKLQKHIRSRLGSVNQPALIVQGRLDATVHPQVPQTIARGVHSDLVEVHWIENCTHVVILDRQREQVASITLKFLERILDSPRGQPGKETHGSSRAEEAG